MSGGVKADFRNAFNEASRAAFLSFAAMHFPLLMLFLVAAYGASGYLTAIGPEGWVRFLSRIGCTQGCPIGPLCFAMALQPCLEAVAAEFPGCTVAALHDDVKIAGPPALARAALARLVSLASERCGLVPTGHKFVLHSPTPLSAMPDADVDAVRGIEADIAALTPAAALARGERCALQSEGVVVAGVPIGASGFEYRYASRQLASHALAHERLRTMPDVQSACLVLCLSLCMRFGHLMRGLGPALLEAVALTLARPSPSSMTA